MSSRQNHLDYSQPEACRQAMDRNVGEGRLVELEQKIAGLQQLIAELLATNQQLRERAKIGD